MSTSLAVLLLSTAPIAVAGALNMFFIKSRMLNGLRQPIDGMRVWRDGRGVFGPNKTWKGLAGSIVLTGTAMPLLGVLVGDQLGDLTVYDGKRGSPINLVLVGALLGLAYVLFELPNSFIKRRLGIGAGRNGTGVVGVAFLCIDQIDSILGCGLVLLALDYISLVDLLVLIPVGGLLHVAIAGLLKLARAR